MSCIPEPVDISFNFGVNDLVTLKGNRHLGLRELKINASEKKALD